MLVNGDAYRQISTSIAIGRFYGFAGALVVGIVASLHILVWLPGNLLKGTPSGGGVRLRLGLFIAGLSLVALMALFVQIGMLGTLDSAAALGRVSLWSLLVMLLSITGPAGLVLALLSFRAAEGRAMTLYTVVTLAALGFAWTYLALQGWVPLITWRV